ncbi:unnamed protein product [Leptosia nina]|uniref:C2H2-type domain-containing protein n=1 Tax=Leptosia nina TaxID=320188 RepID=A0AAV1IWN3_9NEOP
MNRDLKHYSKNFILCGEIDYHCFLCQESFVSFEGVDKHVKWEKHRVAIKNLEKDGPYSKDSIFKIREDYYCEICNEITTNAKKHRDTKSHKDAKENSTIPRYAKGISPFVLRKADGSFSVNGDFKINLLEWHGINKDFCTLCAREIRDLAIHVTLNVHIINLIQTKTMLFEKQYYRKLREDKFYCFLCSNLYPITDLEKHWNSVCEATLKAKAKVLNEKDLHLIKDDPELGKALLKLQSSFFDIDESDKAKCLECGETMTAVLECLLDHRKKHTSRRQKDTENEKSYEVYFAEVTDHGKRRKDLAAYCRENFMKLNRTGSWGFCTICCVPISAHMKQAIEHVQGQRHKGFLELKGLRKRSQHEEPYCEKQKFTLFLKHIFKTDTAYCVKSYLSIDGYSLLLMGEYMKGSGEMKCFACDEVIKEQLADDHCKTKAHIDRVLSCHVMLVEGGLEFIRMIRPNLYHCAICNVTLAYWESVHRHITALIHGMKKTKKVLPPPEARILYNKYGCRTSKGDIHIQLKRLGLCEKKE